MLRVAYLGHERTLILYSIDRWNEPGSHNQEDAQALGVRSRGCRVDESTEYTRKSEKPSGPSWKQQERWQGDVLTAPSSCGW